MLLIQRAEGRTVRLRYTINSFPMRRIDSLIVARLARSGYLTASPRGYYELTLKGALTASLIRSKGVK